MALIPHLSLPLTVQADGTLATVEQDGIEDVLQCVQVLLSTTVGSRIEQPDYGVPILPFSSLDAAVILEAVGEQEPRAVIDVEVIDAYQGDELAAHVLANVSVAA